MAVVLPSGTCCRPLSGRRGRSGSRSVVLNVGRCAAVRLPVRRDRWSLFWQSGTCCRRVVPVWRCRDRLPVVRTERRSSGRAAVRCRVVGVVGSFRVPSGSSGINAKVRRHVAPREAGQRGAGSSLRYFFKSSKKNSLDGTNLPSPNQKTSRTFTPKALHPNRTNG